MFLSKWITRNTLLRYDSPMHGDRLNFKTHNPTVLAIFGATGDLTRKKLIPALFHLWQEKRLPPLFGIVGFSRRAHSDKEFQDYVSDIVKGIPGTFGDTAGFVSLFRYVQGLFEQGESYERLAELLGRRDKEWRTCANKLFYLAVPPQYYETLMQNLAASELTKPCSADEGWTRVIVEKPFGRDLATAEALDVLLGKLFKEEQIYRIDHYLGKETVQNILAFRFSNSFLEPAWDRRSIESIHVRSMESIGIEGRGEFYDGVGALRDVGQNHLLQLLALFTMEHPVQFTGDAIRKKRAEALRALRFVTRGKLPSFAMRGQYEGYRAESGVAPSSSTETYFSIRAFLDTPRWRGVPLYLESGKKLPEARAEVVVKFIHKTPCLCPPELGIHFQNVLRYEIQPDEKIRISFAVKKPGLGITIEEKDFSFSYRDAYRKDEFIDPHVHPYRKLLLDAIEGNQTLFVSTDEIRASWKFIDPIIERWTKKKSPLVIYKSGTTPQYES